MDVCSPNGNNRFPAQHAFCNAGGYLVACQFTPVTYPSSSPFKFKCENYRLRMVLEDYAFGWGSKHVKTLYPSSSHPKHVARIVGWLVCELNYYPHFGMGNLYPFGCSKTRIFSCYHHSSVHFFPFWGILNFKDKPNISQYPWSMVAML